MTLLITVIAAIISTIVWYRKAPLDDMKISSLCFMYWGASLMWMVDAIFEYMTLQAAYFVPEAQAMINDAFLGVSVVVLALVIWMIQLLIADPQGKIKTALYGRDTHV